MAIKPTAFQKFIKKKKQLRILTESEILEQFPDFIIASVLSQGDGFGEYSLQKNAKSNQTVIAKEDSYVISITKDLYLKHLGGIHEKQLQERVDFIKKIVIFQNLEKRLNNLIMFFQNKNYVRGDNIYKEGDKTNYIYLIYYGEVELSQSQVQRKNSDSSEQEILYDQNECKFTSVAKFHIQKKKVSDKTQNRIVVAHLAQGTYFGDQEFALRQNERIQKATAISANVKLVCLSKENLKVISGYSDLMEQIRRNFHAKNQWRNQYKDQCQQTRDILNQNQEIDNLQIKNKKQRKSFTEQKLNENISQQHVGPQKNSQIQEYQLQNLDASVHDSIMHQQKIMNKTVQNSPSSKKYRSNINTTHLVAQGYTIKQKKQNINNSLDYNPMQITNPTPQKQVYNPLQQPVSSRQKSNFSTPKLQGPPTHQNSFNIFSPKQTFSGRRGSTVKGYFDYSQIHQKLLSMEIKPKAEMIEKKKKRKMEQRSGNHTLVEVSTHFQNSNIQETFQKNQIPENLIDNDQFKNFQQLYRKLNIQKIIASNEDKQLIAKNYEMQRNSQNEGFYNNFYDFHKKVQNKIHRGNMMRPRTRTNSLGVQYKMSRTGIQRMAEQSGQMLFLNPRVPYKI